MKIKIIIIAFLSGMLFSCGGDEEASETFSKQLEEEEEETEEFEESEEFEDSGIGIGPIKSLELGDIDDEMVVKGQELFTTNCTACHKMEKVYIGPALKGVTQRRAPEWIMNMILNPEEMTHDDPVAKELYAEYLSPMSDQNLTEEEARAILEYLRTKK